MRLEQSWRAALQDRLLPRQWEERECVCCARIFYAKAIVNMTRTCGRGKCSQQQKDSFLNLPRKRIPLSIESIGQIISSSLKEGGYIRNDSVSIARTYGNTDLIGAGVQIFEPVLFGRDLPCFEKKYVFQPVVRMQNVTTGGLVNGSSSAFVNVCTEQLGATPVQHVEYVNTWLSVLSACGIHMNFVTLSTRISSEDWGNGMFEQLELFFVYDGLELGDASYAEIPTKNNGYVRVSDIGFGLERLVWAVNKTTAFFESLRPLVVGRMWGDVVHDTLRTAALFTVCGVQSSTESPGSHLRRVCKILVENQVFFSEAESAIKWYIQFWKRFLPCSLVHESIVAIREELDRQYCGRISRLPSTSRPKPTETLEAYIKRLVYNQGVSVEDIHRALELHD